MGCSPSRLAFKPGEPAAAAWGLRFAVGAAQEMGLLLRTKGRTRRAAENVYLPDGLRGLWWVLGGRANGGWYAIRGTGTRGLDQFVPAEGKRWQFDGNVTDVFENMLARSIPEYGTMRALVFDLGATLVQPGTAIIDIGCSKGDALAPFVRQFGTANSYIGVELERADARGRAAPVRGSD